MSVINPRVGPSIASHGIALAHTPAKVVYRAVAAYPYFLYDHSGYTIHALTVTRKPPETPQKHPETPGNAETPLLSHSETPVGVGAYSCSYQVLCRNLVGPEIRGKLGHFGATAVAARNKVLGVPLQL